MKLDVAMLSRAGDRARNEDACGWWRGDAAGCWVVSDGAGGHGGGDVASRTVVGHIVREFAAQPQLAAEAAQAEETAAALLRGANRALQQRQQCRDELHDMRATVALLLVDCARALALCAHVGDTRIYGFRDGGLRFRSRDHSLLQGMVDAGWADEAMLRGHPQRSVLLHALGGGDALPAEAQRGQLLPLRQADAFLLCTDGLWDGLDDAAMLQALQGSADAAGWLESLEQALLRTPRRGRDNYSAIALRVSDIGEATRIDAA